MFINQDKSLLEGEKIVVPAISLESFKKLCLNIHNKVNKDDATIDTLEDCISTYDFFEEDIYVEDDLKNIIFSNENEYCKKSEFDDKDRAGFHTTKSGIPYLGVISGGDWEDPLYFIIYYDGNHFRSYMPKYGNVVNLDFMTAFGSEAEADTNKIFATKKYCNYDKSIDDSKTLFNIYCKVNNLENNDNLEFDWDKIEQDIENRFVLK